MRLLLDTHALIWLFEGNPRLSETARSAIEAADAATHVSAVSAIEVTTKYRSGKLPRMAALAENFESLMADYNFAALPVTLRHAQHAGLLAIPHKDPFDRLLIAQTRLEGMTLVSSEALFDGFGVVRLW
ncbi:MAG: type II toxin-antitoxin system VapC family toxin [Caulobacteraceae bacterium]